MNNLYKNTYFCLNVYKLPLTYCFLSLQILILSKYFKLFNFKIDIKTSKSQSITYQNQKQGLLNELNLQINFGPYKLKNRQSIYSTDFIDYFTEGSALFGPNKNRTLNPKIFANYSIAKDPVEEFKFCLLQKSPENTCFSP